MAEVQEKKKKSTAVPETTPPPPDTPLDPTKINGPFPLPPELQIKLPAPDVSQRTPQEQQQAQGPFNAQPLPIGSRTQGMIPDRIPQPDMYAPQIQAIQDKLNAAQAPPPPQTTLQRILGPLLQGASMGAMNPTAAANLQLQRQQFGEEQKQHQIGNYQAQLANLQTQQQRQQENQRLQSEQDIRTAQAQQEEALFPGKQQEQGLDIASKQLGLQMGLRQLNMPVIKEVPEGGTIIAYDPTTGKQLWTYAAPPKLKSEEVSYQAWVNTPQYHEDPQKNPYPLTMAGYEKWKQDISGLRQIMAFQATSGPEQAANRALRAYDVNKGELDKQAEPIRAKLRDISNLRDTLNTPGTLSEALIAPQLLKIIAGGQGSGLRITGAELAAINNSAGFWENLKKWATRFDPNDQKTQLLDAAQKAAIHQLMDLVERKINAKEDIVSKTRHAMVGAAQSEPQMNQIMADFND